jgi:hypothetical protein
MEQLMVGRDESSGTKAEPDDWFSGADPPSVREQRELTSGDVAAAREPTWLEDVAEPEQPPEADSPFARRRFVALAVAVLVLVAVVVAVVAFSRGSASTPTVATTSTPATTTTPAATVPTTPVPSTPTPIATLPAVVLRPGATGAEVKTVQRALARAGHTPGPIDGVYGPKTEQAVSDFQRSAGITVDGVYGPETKKALQQESSSG